MKNSPFKSIPLHNAGPEKCFPRCWEPQPGPRAAPAAAASVHVLTVSPRPGEAQKLRKQDAAGLTAQQRPPRDPPETSVRYLQTPLPWQQVAPGVCWSRSARVGASANIQPGANQEPAGSAHTSSLL